MVSSVQLSFVTVAKVSSLYQGFRSVCRIFRLLGRGRELLSVPSYAELRDLLCEKQWRLCETVETILHRKGLPISLDDSSLSGSASFSTQSSPVPGASLGRVSVTVTRCAEAEADIGKDKKKNKVKISF